MKVDGLTE